MVDCPIGIHVYGDDTGDDVIKRATSIISHGSVNDILNALAFICHITYHNSEVKEKVA